MPKKVVRADMSDEEKIAEFLKKNRKKVKRIEANVSGECVPKSFFARRKKHPFKKSTKVKK